jgi:hypothetical protein
MRFRSFFFSREEIFLAQPPKPIFIQGGGGLLLLDWLDLGLLPLPNARQPIGDLGLGEGLGTRRGFCFRGGLRLLEWEGDRGGFGGGFLAQPLRLLAFRRAFLLTGRGAEAAQPIRLSRARRLFARLASLLLSLASDPRQPIGRLAFLRPGRGRSGLVAADDQRLQARPAYGTDDRIGRVRCAAHRTADVGHRHSP